ncbi:hypothetical protein Aglo01_41070 [Actinokineospora globicatena]|nr:hypothetical protein Aglo01_41070 [Actinokineospora globicatena]GLW85964.1 hypothetical protein Aglo02_36040 [Actinokineospora globicatena]
MPHIGHPHLGARGNNPPSTDPVELGFFAVIGGRNHRGRRVRAFERHPDRFHGWRGGGRQTVLVRVHLLAGDQPPLPKLGLQARSARAPARRANSLSVGCPYWA